MEFLAIITVLAALQIWGYGAVPQHDDWLIAVHQRVSSINSLRLRLALLIMLPVFAVLLLQVALEGVLWGLKSASRKSVPGDRDSTPLKRLMTS